MATLSSTSQRLLLIVDPQNDFISGSLPVPHASSAMDALAAYVKKEGSSYAHILVTTDFHPANHCSFVEQGGQWPSHCVQGTEGVEIYPALMEALSFYQYTILRKGDVADREEYSIFKNAQSAAMIAAMIKEYEVEQIDLCGIAGDICVLDTYKDGTTLYSPALFHLLPDYSPSLDGGAALAAVLA